MRKIIFTCIVLSIQAIVFNSCKTLKQDTPEIRNDLELKISYNKTNQVNIEIINHSNKIKQIVHPQAGSFPILVFNNIDQIIDKLSQPFDVGLISIKPKETYNFPYCINYY